MSGKAPAQLARRRKIALLLIRPDSLARCRAGLGSQAREVDPGHFDDGLGATEHVELAQDVGDVDLHRGLRDLQLVGDLLVLQAALEHFEHAQLLRRQLVQALDQILRGAERALLADRRAVGGGHADRTAEHLADRLRESLLGRRFEDVAGHTKRQGAGDDVRILMPGHDDDRNSGKRLADADDARKTGRAGHRQVEQDEIEL